MNTSSRYWRAKGARDKKAGDAPLTAEDFHREIDNERLATECADAYAEGFAYPDG